MDTEQIQQEMSARRAAIDGRLVLLSSRAASARETARPVGWMSAAAVAVLVMWRVGRRISRRQRSRRMRARMRYAS
jgi:hypothetical protein